MSSELFNIPDELLTKHLMQETNLGERLLVEKWLAEDEAHRKHYARLKWLLEKTEPVAPPYVDEEAAWQKFRQRINTPVQKAEPAAKPKRLSYVWMRIAAMLILVLGMGVLALTIFKDDTPERLAIHSLEHIVRETLSDGSVVTLNKNSSLSYDQFKGKTREVSLKGEAFFSVTPDRKKPFLIRVNDVTVKVVGTSFNIKSYGDKTEVIVESGIVQVTRGGKTVELRPKEAVVVRAADTVLKKESVNDQLYNYYRSKELVCDNTPLWKLVEVLNEAYGSDIKIGRKELRTLPITTTFHNESLDQVLEVIRTTFDLSIEKNGNTIILR